MNEEVKEHMEKKLQKFYDVLKETFAGWDTMIVCETKDDSLEANKVVITLTNPE